MWNQSLLFTDHHQLINSNKVKLQKIKRSAPLVEECALMSCYNQFTGDDKVKSVTNIVNNYNLIDPLVS